MGVELSIPIIAEDPDGDVLRYDFQAEIPGLAERASMNATPSGTGVFRWTPLTSDVGVWPIDFTIDDGDHTEVVTIQIEVRSAVGEQSAPVFRRPLGTGITLDLTRNECIDVAVEVDDPDTGSVMLAQEEPRIPGAKLTSTGGLTASWSWCPTDDQITREEDRFRLVLSADDLTNSETIKNYLVVLRGETKPDCPGELPIIAHTPANESTLAGLHIQATITDDVGLKHEPLLYYSYQPVATPPDLGAMAQVTMSLIEGDMRNGTWQADVPNPVVDRPAGEMAPVYYVIVANDDDDPEGDCDHEARAPDAGGFEMIVTNPGGIGGVGVCEACVADVQCGDTDDLCVRVGVANESFCLAGCTSSSDCEANYECSPTPVESVDGAMARQCVPVSNDCSDPGGTICTDDTLEDNDTLAQAEANPPLAPGSHEVMSCPATVGDDEDWYQIVLTGDTQVAAGIVGGDATDLDLALKDASGVTTEDVGGCLPAGTYYLRVYAWGEAENPYTMTYAETPGCGAVCADDSFEDDDSLAQARVTDIEPDPHISLDNVICSGDDDWYLIWLYDTETIIVDLTHTHADGDLDLHFHDAAGTDLTPCEEIDPSTCSTSQGQSVTDNEHFEYTVPDIGCDTLFCAFYVRVHGWDGASNTYDLQLTLQP